MISTEILDVPPGHKEVEITILFILFYSLNLLEDFIKPE